MKEETQKIINDEWKIVFKDEIATLLSQARTEAIRECISVLPEDMKNDYQHTPFESGEVKGFNSCREQIIKNLEGLKK